MGMAPKTAHLINGDSIDEVPIAALGSGDIIEVRAGEKVPVDGSITTGETYIDEV